MSASKAAAIERRAVPTSSGLAATRRPSTVITEPVVPHETAARPMSRTPRVGAGA